MMTVALFAVLPRVPTNNGNVSLPFNLGEVDPTWFHAVVFSILVVLVIAFASAHAQQVRAQKLAHAVIDSLAADLESGDPIRPREWFDMWRMPSLMRVAPLAQSLRGRHQFYATKQGCSTWLRLVSIGYYGLLKLASLVVYFGLPGWALWQAHVSASLTAGVLRDILMVGGFLAGVALLQVFLSDARYAVAVLQHLWKD